MTAPVLNAEARQTLADYGVSVPAWCAEWFGARSWRGDACGCPDDRCIGYHHDETEACGCLTVLLDAYTAEHQEADR